MTLQQLPNIATAIVDRGRRRHFIKRTFASSLRRRGTHLFSRSGLNLKIPPTFLCNLSNWLHRREIVNKSNIIVNNATRIYLWNVMCYLSQAQIRKRSHTDLALSCVGLHVVKVPLYSDMSSDTYEACYRMWEILSHSESRCVGLWTKFITGTELFMTGQVSWLMSSSPSKPKCGRGPTGC